MNSRLPNPTGLKYRNSYDSIFRKPAVPQSKAELDAYYSTAVDPWEYRKNNDDITRKEHILHTLKYWGGIDGFRRVLDIGAGEGWITKDLPADVKHGYELSDVAAARFPPGVERKLEGLYDLITVCGVLYSHYDYLAMVELVKERADTGSCIILTCNIAEWERQDAVLKLGKYFKQVYEAKFPYRDWSQKLRVYAANA